MRNAVYVQSNKLHTMWDENTSSIMKMKAVSMECFESRSKELKYNLLYINLSLPVLKRVEFERFLR